MTLEDFFTLSELKDGLSSPDRVKELITIMQRENDSIVKNFAETTRQRSTVTATVAATENKNCLDLFIDLNGLYFIDRWLKDAQKLGNDTGNGFLEESIVASLRALERLQIDSQRSSAFGIGRTVQHLVVHGSSVVRDRAKALCDRWMLIQDGDVARRDAENPDDDNDEKNVEMMPLVSTDTIQPTPDKITDQEPRDHVDPSCKSMHDDTLSSRLEQIASSADVGSVPDSSRKTDLRGDEDEEMVDDRESLDRFPTPIPLKNTEAESLKTSSNSQSERDANARGDGVKSDILDMGCGMIDPMEVARRVSIEVRREVDSRERSCSTSEKTSAGGSERPRTPDSTNRKESLPIDGSDKEVTSGSEKTSSGGAAEPVKDAETLVSEREICKTDITASQISEIAQESEANTGFDLNQEVCSEEVDNPINPVSSTISVVSASRAVPTFSLPATPLQFEGTLGWKGSASTSAFRRISDSFSTHNSKQRLDRLDIDLNVTEGIEDKIDDFLSRNKLPIVTGLPSGEESSVEASRQRPERIQFDLNSNGDESAEAVGFDSRRDRRVASVNQNGWQSPSRSSSSSSKQPSLRNIDLNLNDQPVFPYGKQDESVISIFGTELEVKNTKDSLPQPSGRISEPPVNFNFGRSGSVNYGNPPFYGHNGFSSGAAAMFFYGSPGVPIPYMVDSRGAPVGPQIMGFSQPPSPFVTNTAAAGSSSDSSGVGPTLHNFDLNTGLVIDGGNRNPIGGSVDEQYSRVNKSFQGSSSCVVGGKRREPDAARWELFPVNKHPQPQPQPPWR